MRAFIHVIAGILFLSVAYAQSQDKTFSNSAPLDSNDLWVDEAAAGLPASGQPDTALSTSAQGSGSNGHQINAAQHLGFVNLRRVMGSAPQLLSIRARLDGEFAAQQEALQSQSNNLEQMEARLAALPRGEEYSALEEQIIALRREYARAEASFRDAYSVRRNEELAKLQQLVIDQIVLLAKEQSYQFILNENSVIFASNEVDLTEAVIQRLQHIADQK